MTIMTLCNTINVNNTACSNALEITDRKTLSLGTRNVTGSMLLEVRRMARATSTQRTSTEDFGRNDKAW